MIKGHVICTTTIAEPSFTRTIGRKYNAISNCSSSFLSLTFLTALYYCWVLCILFIWPNWTHLWHLASRLYKQFFYEWLVFFLMGARCKELSIVVSVIVVVAHKTCQLVIVPFFFFIVFCVLARKVPSHKSFLPYMPLLFLCLQCIR